ncbi:SixA phosphatase family protein [Reichenbachiella versicolor]|uniref:SixA phosphatase family protein n=1 Tax=Reichenbachiella versicolor TaxID=1821036 RepID=UPI000D6DEA43|nr:histidine phosphatase family protein [Reichenbachiella versicolor]
MTRQLFLIRHAEAEMGNFELKDIDRTLTPDGEVVASKVGNKLSELLGRPDAVLCSSAIRTRQTAVLIAEQLNFNPERIIFKDELYEASTRILLHEINKLEESWKKVVIVAHNPGIPYLAEYISGDILVGVSPAGVVELSYEGDWAEISEKTMDLIQYQTPPIA